MVTSEESDQESFKQAMETPEDQGTSSQAKKKENACKFCDKSFSCKSHLISHITMIHEKFKDHTKDIFDHSCNEDICYKASSKKSCLARQEIGHLKKELEKEIGHLKKEVVTLKEKLPLCLGPRVTLKKSRVAIIGATARTAL